MARFSRKQEWRRKPKRNCSALPGDHLHGRWLTPNAPGFEVQLAPSTPDTGLESPGRWSQSRPKGGRSMLALVFAFQQSVKIGKWPVRGLRRRLFARRARFGETIALIPHVLIVVTIKAKQFPVAAVRWIVIVVVIFVVNGEFPQPLATEFTTATGTDPWIQFECLSPVAPLPLSLLSPSHRDNLVVNVKLFLYFLRQNSCFLGAARFKQTKTLLRWC